MTEVFVNTLIATTAIEYHKAGLLLRDNVESSLEYFGLEPAVNAEMIAIELFLKSLWIKSDYSLPTGLSPEDGKNVLENFNVPNPGDGIYAGHNLIKSWNKIAEGTRRQILGRRLTIEQDLRDLEGIFMRSRYPFEPAEINGERWKKKTGPVKQWKLPRFEVAKTFEVGEELAKFVRPHL